MKSNHFSDFETLINLKESEEINLFDLAGTLDQKYSDLLIYSDFIIIPFEYSDVSVKSTLVFKNLLELIGKQKQNESLSVPNTTKGYKYPNQRKWMKKFQNMEHSLKIPVFKRNCLQTIDTRKLTYEQKYAVKSLLMKLLKNKQHFKNNSLNKNTNVKILIHPSRVYFLYYAGNIVYDLFEKKRKPYLPMLQKNFHLLIFAQSENLPPSSIGIEDVENIRTPKSF